jgi:hypothetical protein
MKIITITKMKKMISLKTITWLIVMAAMTSGCVSYKPLGSKSTPDYNGRVKVNNAQFEKKKNALGWTFNVGFIGAGGYLGYQSDIVKVKNKDGVNEPFKLGGAAVGVLGGVVVNSICGLIAGYGKTVEVQDPMKWIRKSQKGYLYMEGSNSHFTMINPRAEENYKVKNLKDVYDFKTVFPNSKYENNVVTTATNVLTRTDLETLISLYPHNQHIEQTKITYIKKSSSFDLAVNAAKKYPVTNVENLMVDRVETIDNALGFIKTWDTYNDRRQVVANAFKTKAVSADKIRQLQNTFGTDATLTANYLNSTPDNVRQNYYNAMYTLAAPASSAQFDRFHSDYSWLDYKGKNNDILSGYWDLNDKIYYRGKDVIYNFKSILANPLYRQYDLSESAVKQVMTEKFQAEVKNNVKILSENTIGQNNPEWEKWKNSSYTAAMVNEQGQVNYIVYGEIQNKSKYDLPVVLGAGAVLQEVTTIKGQGGLMNALIQFGTSLSGQSTTQIKDVAAASDYYYFPVIPANEKVIYAVLLDFGTQMKSMGVNIMDWIKSSRELNLRETKTEVRYNPDIPNRAQLAKQDEWQRLAKDGGLPTGKLTDFIRGEEVRQDIWDVRYEEYKERMREAMLEAMRNPPSDNSGSNNDDRSSENDEDNGSSSVSIARVKKMGAWEDDSGILDDQDVRYVEFKDGISGHIYRHKDCSNECYFLDFITSSRFYATEHEAIEALYVYKKYDWDTFKKWNDR